MGMIRIIGGYFMYVEKLPLLCGSNYESKDRVMDDIQTKVFCPECGREVELVLGKQEIPSKFYQMMKMLNLPAGEETAYKGEKDCACRKIVKITFVIEAVSANEKSHGEVIIRRGF
jgi:hypothetical protein